MIVATKDDCVHVSGSLVKNQWLFIKAAAVDLLTNHPQGIVIDCSELEHISEEGAKTFLDAMRDIQAAGSRMLVAGLPDKVLQVIRSVPGVRSQLPIAANVEEARASLRLSGQNIESGPKTAAGGVVVPLLPGLDAEYAVELAALVARGQRAPIHLVYLLEVARNLPIGTPLPEEEAAANRMLDQAVTVAKRHSLSSAPHLERARDAGEGVLQLIQTYKADNLILCSFSAEGDSGPFLQLVDTLLRRAPCNVLVGRRAGQIDSNSGYDEDG